MALVQVLLPPDFEPAALDACRLLPLHLPHILRVLRVDLQAVECLLLDVISKVIKDSKIMAIFKSLLLSLDFELPSESHVLLSFIIDLSRFKQPLGLGFGLQSHKGALQGQTC